MSMPGTWEWIIILAIVLVFFGGKRLPQLGGAIGESIKNFKKGINAAGADGKNLDEGAEDKKQDVATKSASKDKESV